MAECRGLAPLARRHALFSKQARLACPVGIPKMVGVGRLAPPRLPDSESGPSATRVEPHAQVEMVIPAAPKASGSPATWRFEAARSDNLSYGSHQNGLVDRWIYG